MTSQRYEAKLLNIIHSIGAPNGAFQSIMSWTKMAVSASYDFQPSPLSYDHQIHYFEKLVGMQGCTISRPPNRCVSAAQSFKYCIKQKIFICSGEAHYEIQ
jgi:hypothetical protein